MTYEEIERIVPADPGDRVGIHDPDNPEDLDGRNGQDYYPGAWYQPLFDYMANEHNTILIQSEMDEIISIVNKMQSDQEGTNNGTI